MREVFELQPSPSEAPAEGPIAPPKPDSVDFARNAFTLRFKEPQIEEAFSIEVARTRKSVFLTTFSFDVVLLLFRLAFGALSGQGWGELGRVSAHALANLAALYTALAAIHRWSQRSGAAASKVSRLPANPAGPMGSLRPDAATQP